jgi:CubicO group peptidase (beta-lactamase class C family)
MTGIRFNSILIAALLLISLFAVNIAAEEAKVVSPESVGLSSARLERLGKAMQGVGYGLGVSSLFSPALAANLSSQGNFGWGGAAMTQVIIDPKEDMVALYFTQLMPGDFSVIGRFQTLVYQAIVD